MYDDAELARLSSQRRPADAPKKTIQETPVADGLEHLEQFVGPLRFPRDYRIREVRSILGTATPVPITIDDGDGAGGDAEQGSQQQAKLWLLASRTAAMPVGRGACTLGTVVVKPTEALQIPTLCLAGCLPAQQYAVVNLDHNAADAPKAFVDWPEFHNGAASGLSLRSEDTDKLTRAWIVFNRPKVPTFSHAGVLLALGLNGHLSSLTATDLYRYLAQEHEATTIGTLLGVAASKIGTGDSATSRMCFLAPTDPTPIVISGNRTAVARAVVRAALRRIALPRNGAASHSRDTSQRTRKITGRGASSPAGRVTRYRPGSLSDWSRWVEVTRRAACRIYTSPSVFGTSPSAESFDAFLRRAACRRLRSRGNLRTPA